MSTFKWDAMIDLTEIKAPEAPKAEGQPQEEMLVWYPRRSNVGDQGEYDDNVSELGPFKHYNIKDLLARFFISTHTRWGAVSNWRNNIIGMTNYYLNSVGPDTPGGAYMPIFDYDGKNIKKIIRKDVKLLQEECGLGNAWVYETRRGFHVYFFTDMVNHDRYFSALDKTQCCEGFKKATQRRGYAVIRVGAKYTGFDIKLLYVLEADTKDVRRMTRKAHIIQALIGLGQECGTHFAIMFPQWAQFRQDTKEWRVAPKKPKAKKIKKAQIDHSQEAKQKNYQIFYNSGIDTGTTTSTSTTMTNHWISKTGT